MPRSYPAFKPPKLSAAEQKAADQARYSTLASEANTAMDEPVTLESFRAVDAVVAFAVSHKDVKAPEPFVERCQAWVEANKSAYVTAREAAAWATLPERLKKMAKTKEKQIDFMVEKLQEAKEKGYGYLQIMSWSGDTFKSAAEHDVAMRLSHMVAELIEKGAQGDEVSPVDGFKLVEETITRECRRLGKSLGQSTSATSNTAESAERLAWFEIADKFTYFKVTHDIW